MSKDPASNSEIADAFRVAFSLLADRMIHSGSMKVQEWITKRLKEIGQ